MNEIAGEKKIQPIRPRWRSAMTDRERFNRQMHYQSVDRCFNMEFGYWEENFDQWDIFTQNGVTDNEEADPAWSMLSSSVAFRLMLLSSAS